MKEHVLEGLKRIKGTNYLERRHILHTLSYKKKQHTRERRRRRERKRKEEKKKLKNEDPFEELSSFG